MWALDVVMMFARISGAGSIEYFIFVHTYYKYTTGLVFLYFRDDCLPSGWAVFSQQLNRLQESTTDVQ